MGTVSTLTLDNLDYKVEVLDGGFCFELAKKHNNTRSKEAMEDIEYIKYIHQGYIDLKCDYITTGNFTLRPTRNMDNWKECSQMMGEVLNSLKKEGDQFTLLGTLPCFGLCYNWDYGVD